MSGDSLTSATRMGEVGPQSKHLNGTLLLPGAFLIPYFLNLVFTGLPLFFFELSLGQFAQSSPIALWSVIPLFQGL